MTALQSLSKLFLEHAPVRVAMPEDAREFEAQLRRAWQAGHDRWPQVALSKEDFVQHLAGRLVRKFEGWPLAQVLEAIWLEELYLACACVRGEPAAIEVLERDYLAGLAPALRGQRLSEAEAEDLCQTLRIQVLVGTAEGKPQLSGYQGQSKLWSWLWVMAMRMASRWGNPLREVPGEDGFLEALPTPEESPELELIKRRYRSDFHQALREAIADLSSQQRYLLRLHYIDRLPTTRMAPLFGRDQSTISRWLTEARGDVHEGTKRRLQERLRLSSQEFDSLMSAIKSRFDLSLSQLLGDATVRD